MGKCAQKNFNSKGPGVGRSENSEKKKTTKHTESGRDGEMGGGFRLAAAK